MYFLPLFEIIKDIIDFLRLKIKMSGKSQVFNYIFINH